MRNLHLLTSGNIGGIESLCRDIGKYSKMENGFCFIKSQGDIYDEIKKNGNTVYYFPKYRKEFSFGKLISIFKIAIKYDCIIVHHADPYLRLYFILLVLFLRKKSINYVHSCYEGAKYNGYGPIKQHFRDFIFKLCFRISDYNIFVSKAGMDSYSGKFKIQNCKCRVIYNGIAVDKIEEGTNNVLKIKNKIELLFVGRLLRVKGVDNFIHAISRINNDNLHISIVGDGNEKANLETMVNELGLKDRIDFYGSQTNVSKFYKRSHIFVYPSIWNEVFGISIVEAMAYGLIIVASNVGGIPEIVNDSKNGFLFENMSTDSLIQNLNEAILSIKNNIFFKLSSNAKNTAKKFSIFNTIEQLDNLIENIKRK